MRASKQKGLARLKSVNLSDSCGRGIAAALLAGESTRRRSGLWAGQIILTSFLFLNFLTIDRVRGQSLGRATPGPAVRMAVGISGAASRNAAQATLVITATIIPMGVVANAKPEVNIGRGVLITLPSRQLQSEEAMQWSSMPGYRGGALKTTTVVAR